MEILTTEEAGSRGSEVEAVPASQDVSDASSTGDVDAGTGASVGVCTGVDTVDKISLISGSGHDATVSCRAVPSRGRDNVAAGGISCSVVATAQDGDAYDFAGCRRMRWQRRSCDVACLLALL